MYKEEVVNLIEYDDLTVDLRIIADVCGIDIARKLIKEFNGSVVYVPRVNYFGNALKKFIDKNKKMSKLEVQRYLGISNTKFYKLRES